MTDLSKPERVSLDSLMFVGSFDWDDEPYQFKITGVWKESRGRYYAASDSGCSCPSPFEGMDYVDDKGVHGPYNKTELRAYFDRLIKAEWGYRPTAELMKEIRELLAKLT